MTRFVPYFIEGARATLLPAATTFPAIEKEPVSQPAALATRSSALLPTRDPSLVSRRSDCTGSTSRAPRRPAETRSAQSRAGQVTTSPPRSTRAPIPHGARSRGLWAQTGSTPLCGFVTGQGGRSTIVEPSTRDHEITVLDTDRPLQALTGMFDVSLRGTGQPECLAAWGCALPTRLSCTPRTSQPRSLFSRREAALDDRSRTSIRSLQLWRRRAARRRLRRLVRARRPAIIRISVSPAAGQTLSSRKEVSAMRVHVMSASVAVVAFHSARRDPRTECRRDHPSDETTSRRDDAIATCYRIVVIVSPKTAKACTRLWP